MVGIQPGRPTSGVEAGLASPGSDNNAVVDRATPSNPGSGAESGRAFDQAVADGKAADRASPNQASNAQVANSAANTSTSSATTDVGAAGSPANFQSAGGASSASGANAVSSTPGDTTALNGGPNAPAVTSAPNAAVASGPTNAPVGNGVSNAPIANGAINPSASNGSPTPAFVESHAQAPLGNAAANSTASTITSIADSSTPPPLAKDTAPRSEAQLRSVPQGRGDVSAHSADSVAPSRNGERTEAVVFDLPVLRLGSSGRAVGLLQRALALLGSIELMTERGFGALTDQAVRSFQEGIGLIKDGVVGNRETWPAINKALVTRHEGIARLADSMTPGVSLAPAQAAEMKQLTVLLGEFSERAVSPSLGRELALAVGASRESAVPGLPYFGDATFVGRAGQAIGDAARALSLPVSALMAANPELTRSYLVLQAQLLAMPNPVRERRFRRQPKQLHPADPEGYLTNPNMNPDFVILINGLIAGLRGDGHDVRVVAGFRSFADQQERFERGRLKPGAIVTKSPAGHSWHNYGLAVDIVLNDDSGDPAWPEASSPFWQRLADGALARGAVWGGQFGFPAHIEYHPALARNDAGSLIEDFECFGLDMVWDRALKAAEPVNGEDA